MTLEQYAALVMQNNSSRNPVAGDDINGCPTILYDFYNEDKDVEYRYLAVMYQADDGFWLVQFASAKDDFDTYEPSFVEAAKERQLRRISAADQAQNRPAACLLPAGPVFWADAHMERRLRDGSGDRRTADL